MPFTSGTYSLPTGNPVVPGTTILSTTTNTTNSDIATALSACLLKDGTQTVTANIPMASHKFTGLSAGTTAGDSVEFAGSPSFTNLAYTGTLTGSTGILNIGSGQVYKDASGNVGIGTSSPYQKLHVYGGAGTAIEIQSSAGNQWVIGDAVGATNGTLVTYDYTNSQHVWDYKSGASGYHALYTAGIEHMRIDSSGNVGIGTSSPSSKLDISTQTAGGNLSLLTFSGLNSASAKTDYVQFVPTIEYNPAGNEAGGLTLKILQNGVYKNSIVAAGTLANASNYLSFGTTNEAMRIDSSGNLLVGTTSVANSAKTTINSGTSRALELVVTTTTNTIIQAFDNPNGTVGAIYVLNSSTTYSTSSDQRLKENIIDAPSALASVNAIKVRSFDWKVDGIHQEYGYIAQELLEVAPEAVTVPSNEDEMMGVDFGKLTPRLVKAIQELKAIIDTQNARIEALEAK